MRLPEGTSRCVLGSISKEGTLLRGCRVALTKHRSSRSRLRAKERTTTKYTLVVIMRSKKTPCTLSETPFFQNLSVAYCYLCIRRNEDSPMKDEAGVYRCCSVSTRTIQDRTRSLYNRRAKTRRAEFDWVLTPNSAKFHYFHPFS